MLDRVSIAAPCTADWDSMPGTDRIRHCAQCNKNVYNLSAMTRRQAEKLLREAEGRLCARLYYRADGTVLTENCSVGLRRIGRRISRYAGAAMSALMAFTSTAAAQIPLVQISPEHARKMPFPLSGTVQDLTGAMIPNATIKILRRGWSDWLTTRSDDRGVFHADLPDRGSYEVTVSAPGFNTFVQDLSIIGRREYRLQAVLRVGSTGGVSVEVVPAFMPISQTLDRIR